MGEFGSVGVVLNLTQVSGSRGLWHGYLRAPLARGKFDLHALRLYRLPMLILERANGSHRFLSYFFLSFFFFWLYDMNFFRSARDRTISGETRVQVSFEDRRMIDVWDKVCSVR